MAILVPSPRVILPLALACLALPAHGETLFSDTFDTDTSANWDIRIGGYIPGDQDYQASWAFDYSAQTYKFFTGQLDTGTDLTVPPAPNSKGTSKGLKLVVNKDAEGSRIVVNLYPKTQNLSGNYVLKFDMFMNHASYADTGSGTTENAWFGINHTGANANWGAFAGDILRADFAAPISGADTSDGCFFTLTPDGGGAKDMWVMTGVAGGRPAIRNFATDTGSSAVPDLDGDTFPDHGDEQGNFKQAFSAPPFEAAGMPGKRWVGIEVSQINDVITLKADGHMLARYTNNSAFKSGKIMIGYSDLFAGVAAIPEESWVIFDNVRVEAVRTVVVDTTDNGSTPGDGKTSLLEALLGLQENDHITFNIPGAGPHVIATPLGGYPLITKSGVVIDGYSQPGAVPNTNPILGGNNAQLKIVLDSTSTASQPTAGLPNVASTRLPFPGYGDSENAILGILEADQVTIRGLSFQSRYTPGSDEDPSIYCIALVQGAENCKVQGNWFGLAPDGTTVKGSASAVAGFRYRVNVDGNNIDTFSGGLIVGTDSDGLGDFGEFNILNGMHIALALELPALRVSGNYFNVLPNGNTFLNVNTIHEALVAAEADDSVENIENGRFTAGTVIGVTGDGVNDANERNIFNYAVYDTLTEFYSEATATRIAGNYYGVGVDGTTTAPPPSPEGDVPNFVALPGTASVLIGSDNDGISDTLEGNLIVGVPGQQLTAAGLTVPIIARANTMKANSFDGFPFLDTEARSYATYYTGVVADPANAVPVVTSFENGILKGKIALPDGVNYPFANVDIYLADPIQFAAGVVMPGTYVTTREDNLPDQDLDLDPGEFEFDLTAFNITGGQQICVAALYRKEGLTAAGGLNGAPAPITFGTALTGPVSNAVSTGASTVLGPVTAVLDGANLRLTWSGGAPPYQVQRRDSLSSGAWANEGAPVQTTTTTVPVTGNTGFFRVTTP